MNVSKKISTILSIMLLLTSFIELFSMKKRVIKKPKPLWNFIEAEERRRKKAADAINQELKNLQSIQEQIDYTKREIEKLELELQRRKTERFDGPVSLEKDERGYIPNALPRYKDGRFLGPLLQKGYYFYYSTENDHEPVIGIDRQSQFFDFNLSGYAKYFGKDVYDTEPARKKNIAKCGAFLDVERDYFSNEKMCNVVKDTVEKKGRTLQDFQDEVIEGLACRYKIHLQVKPEYLVSFIKDFKEFLIDDMLLRDAIPIFKVYDKSFTLENPPSGERNMPVIVVYLALIFGAQEEKNRFIRSIINKLLQRYGSISDQIKFNKKPRFNMQIGDTFIWIAGGDGDLKESYVDFLTEGDSCGKKIPRNLIYTDDFSFFKGYEYEHEHIKRKSIARYRIKKQPIESVKLEKVVLKKDDSNLYDPEKLPEGSGGPVSLVHHLKGYYFYANKNAKKKNLEFKNKKSQFFEFNISNYVSYHGQEKKEAKCAVFMDVDRDYYFPTRVCNDIRQKAQKKGTLKEFQNEVVEALASRYKIHLQVKPEYLGSFVEDLITFFLENTLFRENIDIFKVVSNSFTNNNPPKDDVGNIVPIIVVYLPLLSGTKEEKNRFIRPFINALLQRYGSISDQINFNKKPRFNMQIGDTFIWIAGGDGDLKMEYVEYLNKGFASGKKIPRNLIYTDDFSFFKGYEYEHESKRR